MGAGDLMVNRYAIIEAGVVINVAVAEAPLASNWIQSEQAAIGWSYVNGQFIKPLPVAPSKEEQEVNRKAAYIDESDPIFFMAQRGEATTEEWAAKANEIKARFPYPVE